MAEIRVRLHTWLGLGSLGDLLLVAVRVGEGAEEVVDGALEEGLGLCAYGHVCRDLRRLQVGDDGRGLRERPVRR